jgi:hypothetical protein
MRHNGDGGISMKKRVLTAATVVMLLGTLGPGVASSAPTPIYEVGCGVGFSGQTNVNWQRAKLATVTLQWVAPAGARSSIKTSSCRSPGIDRVVSS